MTFRKQYVFKPTPSIGGGVTPPERIEAAVLAIVTRWNERLPRNRCRILDQVRFVEVKMCLAKLTEAEILAAVDHYATQNWQRTKNAWKTFDHWFEPTNVLNWYEQAADAAERAERLAKRGTPSDPRVAKLTKQMAAKLDADRRKAELAKQWEALGPTGQYDYLKRAKAEMLAKGVKPQFIGEKVVLTRAKELWAAETQRTQRK